MRVLERPHRWDVIPRSLTWQNTGTFEQSKHIKTIKTKNPFTLTSAARSFWLPLTLPLEVCMHQPLQLRFQFHGSTPTAWGYGFFKSSYRTRYIAWYIMVPYHIYHQLKKDHRRLCGNPVCLGVMALPRPLHSSAGASATFRKKLDIQFQEVLVGTGDMLTTSFSSTSVRS